MDLQRLPFLPIHFFYFQFSNRYRWIFLFFFSFLVFLGIVLLFHYHQPNFWNLTLNALAQTESYPLPNLTATAPSPSPPLPLPFEAFRQWVSFSGGPIMLAPFPLVIFVISQILGWALLISASTLVRSRWFFLFAALATFYIFMSSAGSMILPGNNYALPDLLFVMITLGTAYGFQSQWIKGAFIYRLIIFTLLFSLPYLGTYLVAGWTGWQHMVAGNFYLLLIVGLLFLLYTGRDLINLLIIIGNNRKRKENRVSYRWIVISWLLLLISLYFLVHEFFRITYFPLPQSPIRPTHFFVIVALFTVFTSQNIFRQVQAVFTENAAFTFIILAWGIITVSFLGLHYAQGDLLFTWSIDRLLSLILFGFSLGQVIYVQMNFSPLLRKKIHAYYLMGRGPRFGLIVVFFIGIFLFILGEGSEKAKSIRLFLHSQILTQADASLLEEDRSTALELYQYAREIIPASVKAHYNYAALLMDHPEENLAQAIEAYQAATRVHEFIPARLNAANLLLLNKNPQAAISVLQEGIRPSSIPPMLANNLGIIYRGLNQPDSAITYFKQALLADLEQSVYYTNLANVYLDYQRPEEARTYFETAIALPQLEPSTLVNAIYAGLSLPDSALLGHSISAESRPPVPYELRFNQAIAAVAEHKFAAAANLLRPWTETPAYSDANLLYSYCLFQQDSLVEALSRMEFIVQQAPDQSHLVRAIAYYVQQVPEMAEKFFRLAAQEGHIPSHFYAARMLIEIGHKELAAQELQEIRGEHPALWDAAAKELAMLRYAYGFSLYAQAEWDIGSLTREEQVRMGQYADSTGQFAHALGIFRDLIRNDSSDFTPYLEMGKIYLKHQDSMALSTLQLGHQLDSTAASLHIALAQALLQQGDPEAADSHLEQLGERDRQHPEAQLTRAQLYLAQGDSVQAIQELEQIRKQHPLYQKGITTLAQVYLAQDQTDLAIQLLQEVLSYNDENPEIWFQYALAARRWGMFEDAGFAAQQALSRFQSPTRKAVIRKLFTDELEMVSNNGP